MSPAIGNVARMNRATSTTPTLRFAPADEVPFTDVEAVFGTKGDAAHCWCQWFKLRGRAWEGASDAERRDALREQIEPGADGPGLIAYEGATPVGWCAIEPRPHLARVAHMRLVQQGTAEPDFDDAGVWSLSCFVVPRDERRRGIASALAAAAVEYARERGARVVEGYAVEPAERAGTSAASLFHGTVSMFEQAGFIVVARPAPARAIMQFVC